MTSDKIEERIIELEKKVSFQEHTIEELNEVIIVQQKEIDEFKKSLNHLKEQLSSDNLVKKQEDEEPPPHY